MSSTSREPVRIGIDVGGTKIITAALNPDGTEIHRERHSTPRNYDELMVQMRDLTDAMVARLDRPVTIGIGFPGSLSPATELWRNANMTYCNGRPLVRDLTTVIGREIRVENDGNCFALSEAHDGAGADYRLVFALTLGTGVGGGLVIDRALHAGPNRIGGEWGHIPLPWPRPGELPLPPCFCGLKGCAEQYISGTGFARDFAAVTGRRTTAEEILALYEAGKSEGQEAVARYVDRFARFLAVITNILDPDVVVVGGGLSSLEAIYHEVPGRMRALSFGQEAKVKLVRAKHGGASGVRGAAWLWDQSSSRR